MNWEQRYRWRHAAHTSLVLWAGLALVAALACAPALRWLDEATGWAVFHYSPEGARALLGAFAGSMLTFIVFVLSAMLIVVQLASGQLTPRVIALVFTMPRVKIAVAMLTFTYTYTLAVLGRVEERVPHLPVSIAVLLNLVCMVGFFLFVQQLSSGLRPTAVIREVADRGRRVIEQVYPLTHDSARPEEAGAGLPPSPSAEAVENRGTSGVVMAFSVAELVRLAREADAVIEVVPQVGDFVPDGGPLFRVSGGKRPVSPAALRGCIAVGVERTMDQDPRFAFRILADVANKALSPGINDPTTAVTALDRIHHLLLCLGRRQLDDGRARDRDGVLRLVYRTPGWGDYVLLAATEVRQYGAGSMQVGRRLRAMLDHLIEVLPEARRPALRDELLLLERAVRRAFEDEEDRQRAGVGDFQGVGGSRIGFRPTPKE